MIQRYHNQWTQLSNVYAINKSVHPMRGVPILFLLVELPTPIFKMFIKSTNQELPCILIIVCIILFQQHTLFIMFIHQSYIMYFGNLYCQRFIMPFSYVSYDKLIRTSHYKIRPDVNNFHIIRFHKTMYIFRAILKFCILNK